MSTTPPKDGRTSLPADQARIAENAKLVQTRKSRIALDDEDELEPQQETPPSPDAPRQPQPALQTSPQSTAPAQQQSPISPLPAQPQSVPIDPKIFFSEEYFTRGLKTGPTPSEQEVILNNREKCITSLTELFNTKPDMSLYDAASQVGIMVGVFDVMTGIDGQKFKEIQNTTQRAIAVHTFITEKYKADKIKQQPTMESFERNLQELQPRQNVPLPKKHDVYGIVTKICTQLPAEKSNELNNYFLSILPKDQEVTPEKLSTLHTIANNFVTAFKAFKSVKVRVASDQQPAQTPGAANLSPAAPQQTVHVTLQPEVPQPVQHASLAPASSQSPNAMASPSTNISTNSTERATNPTDRKRALDLPNTTRREATAEFDRKWNERLQRASTGASAGQNSPSNGHAPSPMETPFLQQQREHQQRSRSEPDSSREVIAEFQPAEQQQISHKEVERRLLAVKQELKASKVDIDITIKDDGRILDLTYKDLTSPGSPGSNTQPTLFASYNSQKNLFSVIKSKSETEHEMTWMCALTVAKKTFDPSPVQCNGVSEKDKEIIKRISQAQQIPVIFPDEPQHRATFPR